LFSKHLRKKVADYALVAQVHYGLGGLSPSRDANEKRKSMLLYLVFPAVDS
jgi:hypothetical protein